MHGKKQSVFKEHQVFSRVHIDDIVNCFIASIQLPNPLVTYNISDDDLLIAFDKANGDMDLAVCSLFTD